MFLFCMKMLWRVYLHAAFRSALHHILEKNTKLHTAKNIYIFSKLGPCSYDSGSLHSTLFHYHQSAHAAISQTLRCPCNMNCSLSIYVPRDYEHLPESDLRHRTFDSIVKRLSEGDGLTGLIHRGHLSLIHSQCRTTVDRNKTAQPVSRHSGQYLSVLDEKDN